MTKIKCINNRWMVIKPHPPESKTDGGIILLDEKRNDIATVEEIAKHWTDQNGVKHNMDVKKGDTIFYNSRRGVPIVEKDIKDSYGVGEKEELLFILYDDIYFVVE